MQTSSSSPATTLLSAGHSSDDSVDVDGNPQQILNSSLSTSPIQVLGVCGGIGSGKSTACTLLVTEGHCLAHLDADSMAHSVYQPGSDAVKDMVKEFGTSILQSSSSDDVACTATPTTVTTMEIDRRKLGTIVFADRSAMAKLERIVWPHVKALIKERINTLQQEWQRTYQQQNLPPSQPEIEVRRPIVVLEAAVLLDAGWDDLLNGVWVVTASRETALKRLMETRGLSQEEAEKRINSQASRRGIGNLSQEIEAGVVTGVIENNEGLEELKVTLKNALDDPTFWKSK